MSEKANTVNVDDEDNESVASGSMGATAASNVNKPNYPGPNPNVKYPLTVIYCGGMNQLNLFKNLFVLIR